MLVIISSIVCFQIGVIWSGIILSGIDKCIYRLITSNSTLKGVNSSMGNFLDLCFYYFTRLFFRSINLNPAEANEIAWNTAKDMVNQIGGSGTFRSFLPFFMSIKIFSVVLLGNDYSLVVGTMEKMVSH